MQAEKVELYLGVTGGFKHKHGKIEASFMKVNPAALYRMGCRNGR